MSSFSGFTPKGRQVQIPDNFFTEVLPVIDDPYILKILLLAFQIASHSEDQISYFDPEKMCVDHFTGHQQKFWEGLGTAVNRGWLLEAEASSPDAQLMKIYFLNTPGAVAAIEALRKGEFHITTDTIDNSPTPRPDIFRLYEENIGPLTPIIADSLKDLEESYPPDWINNAIQTAVKNNARSLRYIEVVLQNWQEEGTYDRTDRRRRKKTEKEYDPERYKDGEFSDYFDNE